MSVGTNTFGTVSTSGSGTALNYSGLTFPSGVINPGLVLYCAFSATVSGVTATWDSGGTNQAMYNIGSVNQSGGNPSIMAFGLPNPTPGNKNLLISWTGTAICTAIGVAYQGMNQGGGTSSFTNFLTSGGTSSGPTISSTAAYTSGGMQSILPAIIIAGATISGYANATLFTSNTFATGLSAGGQYSAPTGSPWGSTFTLNSSTTYGIMAFEIVPAQSNIIDGPMVTRGVIPRAGAPLNMAGSRLFPFSLPVTAAPPPVVGSTLPMMGVG